MQAMVYVTLFLIGLLGLIAQALLGGGHSPAHTGHVHGPSNTGPALHGHGGHSAAGHHAHAGHGKGSTGRSTSQGRPGLELLLTLFSPLTIFSLCLGAGATGMLLKHAHLTMAMVGAIAAVGGIVFYSGLVRPLWSLIFQFASKPSKALEGTMAKTAEAVSKFDTSGRGVVKLNVDGQIVRVLAELDDDDRASADSIKIGDSLTVTSVDGRSNSCRVTRL